MTHFKKKNEAGKVWGKVFTEAVNKTCPCRRNLTVLPYAWKCCCKPEIEPEAWCASGFRNLCAHCLAVYCVLWPCKCFNFQTSSVISLKAFKPWRIPPTDLTRITIIMFNWAAYGVDKVTFLFTYFECRKNVSPCTRHHILERIWPVGSSKHGMNPPRIQHCTSKLEDPGLCPCAPQPHREVKILCVSAHCPHSNVFH